MRARWPGNIAVPADGNVTLHEGETGREYFRRAGIFAG
jgi:hypothetical protein